MSKIHTIDVDDTRYPSRDNRRAGGLTVSATVRVDDKGVAWATLIDARNAQAEDCDGLPRQCDLLFALQEIEARISADLSLI
jgi:hypothetical protein